MRKLVSAGAVLFVLGVAFLSKPAVAMVHICSCDYCAASPGMNCYVPGPPGRGTDYLCPGYTALFC